MNAPFAPPKGITIHPEMIQGSEEWRIIADFPDYAVSNLGQVKRVVPDQKGRISKLPMNASLDGYGYPQVNLFKNAMAHTRKVHTLVCAAFNGARPLDRSEVAHGDGCKTNNCAGNLRWATAKENADDRDAHGTTARGDRHASYRCTAYLPRGDDHWSRKSPHTVARGALHPSAKLTDTDVRAIRSDPRKGNIIACEYGITPTTVSHIRRRKTWRHVA